MTDVKHNISLPAVAIEWMASNLSSDVELAILSNVSKSWRRIVIRTLCRLGADYEQNIDSSAEKHHQRRQHFSLLVAGLVHQLIADASPNQQQVFQKYNSMNQDAFCLAWFAPENIKETRISRDLDHFLDDDDEYDSWEDYQMTAASLSGGSNAPTSIASGEPFAFALNGGQPFGVDVKDDHDEEKSDQKKSLDSGGGGGGGDGSSSRHSGTRSARFANAGSSVSNMITTRRPVSSGRSRFVREESLQNKRPPARSGSILVAEEWRGYNTPYEVLCHFGYTQEFLLDLLQALPPSTTRDHLVLMETNEQPVSAYETNVAVRGATVARPESYCLCYNNNNNNNNYHGYEDSDPFKTENCSLEKLNKSGNSNINTNSSNHRQLQAIRKREQTQVRRRQARKKRALQRDVLPRIIESADPESKPPLSLQFLNGSGNHAVCMVTPPFACGPVSEPITIFCVGIATEDGCFLSGLHHRFELGHLYPVDELSEITESSAICVATERWEHNPGDICGGGGTSTSTTEPSTDSAAPSRNSNANVNPTANHNKKSDAAALASSHAVSHSFDSSSSAVHDGDDDDYNSDDSDMESQLSCQCMFRGVGEKMAEMDRDPEVVTRGKLGPGAWHCYVAIFNGRGTRIRVDGVEEPVVAASFGGARQPHFTMLDGLTIGSDHCFGLSLCCGQGPGGEGAIAETAVFHGHMSQGDVENLERRLMTKHSIARPAQDFWQENEMQRKAHALFLPSVANVLEDGQSLPLRYLTRHHSVAWQQYDPVSGRRRRISKIGVKNHGESSDW